MQTAESTRAISTEAHNTKVCNLPFEPPEPLNIASLPVDCIEATIAEGAAGLQISVLFDGRTIV
jgi:hypothetical protein